VWVVVLDSLLLATAAWVGNARLIKAIAAKGRFTMDSFA
jgi:hypothetical protein